MISHAPHTRVVILATDETYAPPCGVTMESLLRNTAEPQAVRFAIFGRDLHTQTKSRLRAIARNHGASTEFYTTDAERFQDLPIIEVGSLDTFTRLYAPEVFASYERVLYIDCDILVERDIGDLFTVDMDGAVAAAVPHGPTPFVPLFREQHGLPSNYPVCNAGVLLIDPRKWVAQDVAGRAVDWIKAQAKETLFFPDQDAINVILQNKIKALPPQWNMEARYYQEWWMGITDWWKRQAIGEQLILHYTGPQKPWKKWTFVPKQRTYRAYLSDTPFASSGLMTTSDAVFEFRRLWTSFGMLLRAMRVRGGKIRRATQDGA